MTGTRQLLCCCQAGRTCTHHGHFFTCFVFCGHGLDPTLRPRAVNDGVFNGFDTNRIVVHIQGTCRFTGCGANTTCEFGEVIGAVQHVNRFLPIGWLTVVHQVIEVWNDVVHRATVVAKRCAAIHATRRLRLGLLVVQTNHKFFVMLEAFSHRLVALF